MMCNAILRNGVAVLAVLAMGLLGASAPVRAQADLDALIKGAKAEGEVSMYSGATENIIKRVGDAFTALYGIKYSFIRLAGAQALQRYSTEAESGTFSADLVFNGGGTQVFVVEAVKKGWVEPIRQAGIPALNSGQFPAKFITGATATIQLAPWGISYNTDKVSAADAPKDWPDILNPRFKGQIVIADLRSTDAILEHWALMLDKYGEGFFTKLREMNPRRYPGNVPAAAGLAAGEGHILLPSTSQLVQLMKAKGAPIADLTPSFTTGVEMQVFVTARNKAKRPNAGRLFAHFVMTPEGNKLFNADPGSVSIYDTTNLPREYEPNKPGTVARKDAVAKLLGFD
jgi:iron(III) transport system substrate-binding protein